MNSVETSLELAEALVHASTGVYLCELQRIILMTILQNKQSVQGLQIQAKTQEKIAVEWGYSVAYLQKTLTPKLWHLLSQALNQPVTAANVYAVLEKLQGQQTQEQQTQEQQTQEQQTQEQQTQEQQTQEQQTQEQRSGTVDQALSDQALTNILQMVKDNPFVNPSGPPDKKESRSAMKGNILLVDDQPQNLDLLSTLLEEQGYEVRQTIDPRLVMSSVSLVPPDLILLDVNMPQMDGYTLCQHLKSNVQTRDIPVIFVSALDEAWDKVKGFTVGGVDYITKPFKVVEVLARVKNQLKLRRLQKTLQEQNQDLRTTVEQLQQANQELQRLSALDPLTHVANRRRFDDYLQRSWNRAVQKSEPLALVLFDIDYFKRYNDTYGHPKGDACLYLVAQVLKRASPRAQDLACRYGGEEFALILPDTNLQGAKTIAEQGLARVQALKIEHRQSAVSSHVTLSGGVVSVVPTPTEQLQRFMTLCDRALYRAKAQGRNRIVTLTYAVGP